MRGLFSFILFSLTASLALANQALFFPVERNHIQIFPQRFEYLLLDKDHFRIGDIMLDANKVDFQLINPRGNTSQYKFIFRWPADLLKDGEILIKDSSSKAIWIQKISTRDTKVLEEQAGDDSYRSSTATYESPILENEFLNRLQYAAYFKFCIHKEDQGTRIYLCSKDLYVKKDKNKFTVLSRDSFRKDSYVEINGRPVDPQGAIFLNEQTDNISLRALLVSGASVEINTRKKDIQYKDVVLSENKEELIIRAKGTEPVDQSKVKRTSPSEWEMNLPLDRPILYLKGEGDIPMRQEFLIDGPVRSDAVQVPIASGWAETTYSSELQLKLSPSEGANLINSEKKTSLSRQNLWTLTGLEKGKLNRHYLNVKTGEGDFVGAYEVYRGFPFEASTRFMLPFFSQSQASWWLPGFRFGLSLNYDKALAKTSSDPDWSALGLEFLLRFSKGLNMKDPGAGLIFFYKNASLGSSLTLLGIGGFYDIKDAWDGRIPWLKFKFTLPLTKSGGDLSLKTSWDLEASARRFDGPSLFYEAGVRWLKTSLSSDNDSNINYNRNMLFMGVGSLF